MLSTAGKGAGPRAACCSVAYSLKNEAKNASDAVAKTQAQVAPPAKCPDGLPNTQVSGEAPLKPSLVRCICLFDDVLFLQR